MLGNALFVGGEYATENIFFSRAWSFLKTISMGVATLASSAQDLSVDVDFVQSTTLADLKFPYNNYYIGPYSTGSALYTIGHKDEKRVAVWKTTGDPTDTF